MRIDIISLTWINGYTPGIVRYYLICCLFPVQIALHAQRVHNPVVIHDPLPSSYVTDIDQDTLGFMWVATRGGLCRFDGHSLLTFRHDPQDPQSLPHDGIWEILYDRDRNVLWIGTEGGLSMFNLEDYTFRNPDLSDHLPADQDPVVEALCLDDRNQLWFGIPGTGVASYCPKSDSVVSYSIPDDFPHPIEHRSLTGILDIARDPVSSRTLWLGTAGGGLLRFDIETSHYTPYFMLSPQLESQIYFNQIRSVLPLDNRRIWLGTWSKGLIRYVPDRSAMTPQFPHAGEYVVFHSWGSTPPLLLVDDGYAYYNGIAPCLMDLETGELTDCITARNAFGKWYAIQVNFIDDRDRKWATSEHGLHIFDPLGEQIKNYQFSAKEYFYYVFGSFIEIGNGQYLIAYENSEGAFVLDEVNENVKILTPSTNRYLTDTLVNAQGFVHRPDGDIWLVERHKFYRVELQQNKLIPLHLPLDTLPHLWTCTLQDQAGDLWLGSGCCGLVYYQPTSGVIRMFESELSHGVNGSTNPLHHLFEDSRKNIWISQERGFSTYLRARDTVLNFHTLNGVKFSITNCIEDRDGYVWAGAPGFGLVKMASSDPGRGIVEVIGIGEGLLNTDITYIAHDTFGRFWMLTRAGLQEYDPVTKTSRLFDGKDGVIMHDPRFNRNPTLLSMLAPLSDGRMAYTPRAGFSTFDPAAMTGNTEIPRPYIKSIMASDSLVRADLFPPVGSMTFPFTQNHIAIECSAIGYTHADRIRFEYHLGEEPWRPMENRRVQFSKLAPGEYQFLFRVISSAGLASDTLSWDFDIRVPWWRSWWFIGICVVACVLLIWLVIRIREKRLTRLRQKEHEMQMLLASLESRALRNQMNPHFLFNIFNNIQELILTGDNEKAYTYTTKFSKLLRMILDNARGDEITIEQEKTFLTLYLELESLRFDDVFNYSIRVEEGLGLMHIPVFVIQPLVENAIRHGLLPKPGMKRLLVQFFSDGDNIICEVVDNGVGMDGMKVSSNPKDREHALQLIQNRLSLLNGGSLNIHKNSNGEGTKVRVSFSLKSINLSEQT